ncbi:hypothetical protein OG874_00225 [Nocardia sp. NBC_00565]|uniref:hypothetical protein n=1 Tax=Nocardia sp. NBC_00565 TaxID=2975993 RepID=UPI002E7FCBEE|nr:hypothetical protein [Nocardia sp. NBC_00565]WUC03680.1 hypothetical protein OG874_00225 [Nocardia sp. NBC_00565]
MTITADTYRKKPVEIQAMQWDGTTEGATAIIDWALSLDGTIRYHCEPENGCDGTAGSHRLAVDTLEGTMLANPRDWVIRGIKGEFYPCKDEIFRATYEAVASC